ADGLTHINEVLAGIDPNLVQPWFPSPVYAKYAFCTPEFIVSFDVPRDSEDCGQPAYQKEQ
ncbi:MAG: hypothetical protein ACXQTR_04955, partial [Candidatus Methanospirareceae archaeon]